MIIASTTAAILGLTMGGIKYPWDSARVLCPLILGIVGLILAFVYETKWAKQPTVSLLNIWLSELTVADVVIGPPSRVIE